MSKQPFQAIIADTKAAERGVMPDVLVDVYSDAPPAAARANGGTSTEQGAAEACAARRAVVPGTYDTTKR